MTKWIEDAKKTLTHEDLKAFSHGLSSSQGSYGRIYNYLSMMEDTEIKKINNYLKENNFKNELMTIINLFEG